MRSVLGEKGITTSSAVIVSIIVTAIIVGGVVYVVTPKEEAVGPGEVTQSAVEAFLKDATESVVKEVLGVVSPDILAEVSTKPRHVTIAVLHFSSIAGTTWSGAQDAALKRLDDLYPWLEYIWEEEVGPDETIPVAEDFIATKGADIVLANAEFMGLPLMDITEKYPDVYFGTTIVGDTRTERNFIRYFPRQYQAFYLAGLVAGAITKTGKIGEVSSVDCIQVYRRRAAFFLGVKDANPDAVLYVKYAGSWYDPPTEADVAKVLIDEYGCDVITQQTDSSAPVEVADEKGVWFIGKDLDLVGMGWADDETVAVSFDTRWDVVYEKIIKEYIAGDEYPKNLIFVGMEDRMFLKEGEVPAVDIVMREKRGVDAISPYARPLIPSSTIELIKTRRDLLMKGRWDPFIHELVSAGTGFEIPGSPVPSAGTVVKPEGEAPTDEWLLSKFNFDLEGTIILG